MRKSEVKPTRAHHSRVGANYPHESLWNTWIDISYVIKRRVLERTFDPPHLVVYCGK